MPAHRYISPHSHSLRPVVLLLMAVVSLASSSRVTHAHEEGDHPHRLETVPKPTGESSATPKVPHSHIHLFGLDLHIPSDGSDESSPNESIADVPPTVAESLSSVERDFPVATLIDFDRERRSSLADLGSPCLVNAQRRDKRLPISAANLGRMLRLKLVSLTV